MKIFTSNPDIELSDLVKLLIGEAATAKDGDQKDQLILKLLGV